MENKNLNAAQTPEESVREVSAHTAMKPIHIVTGFFDIGRAHFDGYERDNETYFAYFRFWARIENDMTVYCASEHAAQVAAIRAEYGLEDKTEIVRVDDPFTIEPELYRRMERAAADPGFRTSRFYRGPENDAPYSYITMLKAWCLSNAAERTGEDCMLAWVDFGINHCGVKYARSEDFGFLWEYPFPDKITAFCHQDPAEASLLDTLLFMTPVFDGSVVVMPRALCAAYWQAVRGAMDALVKLGCVDDDQMLSLIVYKDQPELFDIHLGNGWYSGFELCSNQTFNLTEQEPPVFNEKIVRTMRRLADAPQHPFIRRMYEKTIRYYYPEAEKKGLNGMEKQIRVSVVTPVYNDERHLEQCLESLCRQTLREIEFVCVDDGSTDGSSAILQSYRKRDERFVIVRQPNRGLGAAMNAGIRQSRGEYIGIVESDDFADPDMFRTLYDTAVGLNAEVIKSDCWLYYNGESIYSATFEDIDCSGWIFPLDYPDAFYLQRNWSGLYSREFLVRNEIRENETPGASFQDVSFNFLVMACVKRFYYLKKAFLHYRADNALSSTHSRGKTFALCDECDYFERFLKERNGDNRLWAILANSRFRLCQREARFRVDEGQVYPFLSRAIASYRDDHAKGRYDRFIWNTGDWEEACHILENPEAYLAGVKELLDERETKRQAFLNLIRNEAEVYIYGAGQASSALRELLSSYGVGIRGFVMGGNGTQVNTSENVFDAREVVRDDPLILVPVRQSSRTGTKAARTDKGWRVLSVDCEMMRILKCDLSRVL